MATAQHIQSDSKLIAKFSAWMICHRNSSDLTEMLTQTTNIHVMYTDEKGNVIATNGWIRDDHARAADVEACILKGIRRLFDKDEVELVTQKLQSGIPTIRMLYDDRRRGLTGGINWMLTSDYAQHLTQTEKEQNPKKYTIVINIRERTTERCGNPACVLGESKLYNRCAQCDVAVYCCTDCQRAHWKTHKPTCLASPMVTKKAKTHNA